MRTRGRGILIGLLAAMLVMAAVPALTVYYDGFFTNVLVKGEVRMEGPVYEKIKYVTGDTTLSPFDGNAVYATLTVASTLSLPVITSEMDGWPLTIKLESGSTTFTVNPGSGDKIEATQGTVNGTTVTDIDAVGDCRKWRARYVSGGTSYWAFESKEVQ